MVLRLKALASKEPGFAGRERMLAGPPLTIGRGSQNDWVLNDEQRHVSKTHCRIETRGETSVLVDLSSNGVLFEGEESPLGLGMNRRLKSGDVFLVGDYRFMVVEDAGPAPARTLASDVKIADILDGRVEPAEARLSKSAAGDADLWLRDLGAGAAESLIHKPLAWSEPPATAAPVLPDARVPEGFSHLDSRNEHVPAVGGRMEVPRAQVILPDSWHLDADDAHGVVRRPEAVAPATLEMPITTLLEGAGLPRQALQDQFGDAVLRRAGQLLRVLLDGLDQLQIATDGAERDAGVDDARSAPSTPREDLVHMLDPTGAGDAALAQRLDELAKRIRGVGEAVRAAADTVGNRLRPDAIERRARLGMIFPLWPQWRQACWRQFTADFEALRGDPGADAADIVLAPVRAARAAAKRNNEG